MARKTKVYSLWNAIWIMAVVVVVGCLGYWLFDQFISDTAERGYKEIADNAGAPADEPKSLADMTVDWDYLRSINPDVVAWIYMPGTPINYPVVQGETNYDYLHTDFSYNEGFTARGGAIFMDSDNKKDMSDAITYIYGHHMNDGSMFACLSLQLSYQGEFNAHRDFYVLTPEKNYRCHSFSLMRVSGDVGFIKRNFNTDEERIKYLQNTMDSSVVSCPEGAPEAAKIGKVFSLATCDYTAEDYRAVLYGQVAEEAVPNAKSDDNIRTEDKTKAQEKAEKGELTK